MIDLDLVTKSVKGTNLVGPLLDPPWGVRSGLGAHKSQNLIEFDFLQTKARRSHLAFVWRKSDSMRFWLLWATRPLRTPQGGSRNGLTRLVPLTLLVTRSRSTIVQKIGHFQQKVICHKECAGSFMTDLSCKLQPSFLCLTVSVGWKGQERLCA